MTLHHYAAAKIVSVGVSLAGAVVFAMDKDERIAYIALATAGVGGIVAITLQIMSRRTAKETKDTVVQIAVNVDGTLSKLREEMLKKDAQLADAQQKLSHAEGHREGGEQERDREEEKK
jgi:phosphate/sulfate permease